MATHRGRKILIGALAGVGGLVGVSIAGIVGPLSTLPLFADYSTACQTQYGGAYYGNSSWDGTSGACVPVSATATPVPSATATPTSSGGGGGGGTASPAPSTAPAPTTITPGSAIPAALESIISTAAAPANVTVTVSSSTGGVVVAGNTALSIPPGAFAGISGSVTVNVTASPSALSAINNGGGGQFSPNGTVLDVSITDQSGNAVTTFPQAVTVVTRPNASDLGMANGNFSLLTMFYVIDANSPAGENPNHFPLNTRVVVPPSAITVDATNGYIAASLNFIGSILGVGTNPVGYVQTLNPKTSLLSSFDTSTAQTFGAESQFSYLQVTEPGIGNTLLVLNPDTGNYAYVKASDVGPSGPPPAKTATGVVRGLLSDS